MIEFRFFDDLPRSVAWGGKRFVVVVHEDADAARDAIEAGPDGAERIVFETPDLNAMTKAVRLGHHVGVVFPPVHIERAAALADALNHEEER